MCKQEKVIIFSHENDIDGIGPIILGKMTFGDIQYVLASNVHILEAKFREYLESGELNKFDRIYVTDLALYDPSISIVDKDQELSKKVKVFSSHRSAINEGYDKYDFATIIDIDENGKKRGATDLFYTHLCSVGLLSRTKVLDEFVELTRLENTWEWKKAEEQGIKAHDLAILFNDIGIEAYIESMLAKICSEDDSIEFTEEEMNIITSKKAEYLATLQNIWNDAEYFVDEFNNEYAGVFADYEYRNELGEYVRSLKDIEIKYLVLIAIEKGAFGQKSYRSIADKFDVGKIAEAHGGDGHPAAASVNITKEQKEKSLILKKTSKRESIKYLVDSNYHE